MLLNTVNYDVSVYIFHATFEHPEVKAPKAQF